MTAPYERAWLPTYAYIPRPAASRRVRTGMIEELVKRTPYRLPDGRTIDVVDRTGVYKIPYLGRVPSVSTSDSSPTVILNARTGVSWRP